MYPKSNYYSSKFFILGTQSLYTAEKRMSIVEYAN